MNLSMIQKERTNMKRELSPSTRWSQLKAKLPEIQNITNIDEVLSEIESIDNDTPWSEVEPTWWLDMEDYRRKLFNHKTAK